MVREVTSGQRGYINFAVVKADSNKNKPYFYGTNRFETINRPVELTLSECK